MHPGGPSILTSVEHALSLKEEALEVSPGVLDEYGNMSSATILFILDRLQKRGADRPCIALGFGPGLTVEAMLLPEESAIEALPLSVKEESLWFFTSLPKSIHTASPPLGMPGGWYQNPSRTDPYRGPLTERHNEFRSD